MLTLSRRSFVALLAGVVAPIGCGASPPRSPPPRAAPLRTRPLIGLFPAAGLSWIVDVQPLALMAHAGVAAGVDRFITEERALRFRELHGGFDPRRVHELVVAQYGERSRVYATRGALDTGRIERAFTQAATFVEARAVDQAAPPVVRLFGEVQGTRAQLLLLDRDVVALEIGALGPVRAMSAFARGKLVHAKPALAATPLDTLSASVSAPFRAFFRGPFTGDDAAGLGGTLAAASGVLLWFAPSERDANAATLGVRVEMGSGDPPASAAPSALRDRMRAAVERYRQSSLGRLLGVHEAALEPADSATGIGFSVRLDLRRAFDGLYDAVAGDAAEIFNLTPRP